MTCGCSTPRPAGPGFRSACRAPEQKAPRYRLHHEPFVAFDLFSNGVTLATDALEARLGQRFPRPHVLHAGAAVSLEVIDERLGELGHQGALDRAEGAMWRVERGGVVVTRAKYVRPGKADGALLPENSGRPALWNWTDEPPTGATTS